MTIIPEINKYKTFDVPIVSLIKSKLYLFGISRIISKIFLKLHCLLSKEKEGVWMHMQYTSRFYSGFYLIYPVNMIVLSLFGRS